MPIYRGCHFLLEGKRDSSANIGGIRRSVQDLSSALWAALSLEPCHVKHAHCQLHVPKRRTVCKESHDGGLAEVYTEAQQDSFQRLVLESRLQQLAAMANIKEEQARRMLQKLCHRLV